MPLACSPCADIALCVLCLAWSAAVSAAGCLRTWCVGLLFLTQLPALLPCDQRLSLAPVALSFLCFLAPHSGRRDSDVDDYSVAVAGDKPRTHVGGSGKNASHERKGGQDRERDSTGSGGSDSAASMLAAAAAVGGGTAGRIASEDSGAGSAGKCLLVLPVALPVSQSRVLAVWSARLAGVRTLPCLRCFVEQGVWPARAQEKRTLTSMTTRRQVAVAFCGLVATLFVLVVRYAPWCSICSRPVLLVASPSCAFAPRFVSPSAALAASAPFVGSSCWRTSGSG